MHIYIYICTLAKENSDAMTYETSKDHSKVKFTSTHFHSNYGLQTSKKCIEETTATMKMHGIETERELRK